MIFKLIYILCLVFSVCENFYASKADSISLHTKQFLLLKDVALSDALMARQKDNAGLRTVRNIYNDSSNILNASSSVSELTPETYPGNKSIDIETEKKIDFHHEHPALDNVTSTIYKNTDFLLFGNETLVRKYRSMNSTKFEDVNQTRDADDVAPSNGTKNYDTMKATSARSHALHRVARADKESVQTVLKKIFPDRFFPEKGNSDLNGSRKVNNKNNNSPRRRQKIKKLGTRRFGGESVYFRQNAPAAAGAGTAAPAEAAAPAGTAAPAEAAAPAGTAAPAETAAPGGAAAPAGTAAPGGTAAPAGAAAPGETAAPAGTAAPGETVAPAGTAAPGETVAPAGTGAPAGTAAPGETAPPAGTEAPAASATAGAVTTSAPTQGATGGNQTGASSGQQVNYHYHFHYFGGLAAPTLPGGGATTIAPSQK